MQVQNYRRGKEVKGEKTRRNKFFSHGFVNNYWYANEKKAGIFYRLILIVTVSIRADSGIFNSGYTHRNTGLII
jgi:hypothetical protein